LLLRGETGAKKERPSRSPPLDPLGPVRVSAPGLGVGRGSARGRAADPGFQQRRKNYAHIVESIRRSL